MDPSAVSNVRVALIAPEKLERVIPLLRAVAKANDVELVRWNAGIPGTLAGVLVIRLGENQEPLPQALRNLPSFAVEIVRPAETSGLVKLLSNSSKLSPLLRSRCLHVSDAAPAGQEFSTGEVLAEINGRPVWVVREENGISHQTNIQADPWISDDDRLFEHLNGQRMMRLVPLIEWLRSISTWAQWQKPPTQACFMFDDPNLHSNRYGFVSFPLLAAEGRKHGYHTSFATVPLDQYYINKSAARVFRESREQLSLLVHGVDHTRRELASDRSSAEQLMKLRRGIRLIERLERKAGLTVARIMAPPHGAFSARSFRDCSVVGFEAACVSWGSIWYSNQNENWASLLGADPIAAVQGLPVIPRFRMAKETENQILLAAYLNQAIIPTGHQWELGDGMDLLRNLAGFINRLGDVRWASMEQIARSGYWWRQVGDTLILRPFSRQCEVHVPEGIRNIKVIKTSLGSGDSQSAITSVLSGLDGRLLRDIDDRGWTLPGEGRCVLSIRLKPSGEDTPRITHSLHLPLKALARRLLVESRDRLMPMLPASWQRR